jgi:hypothetical protein
VTGALDPAGVPAAAHERARPATARPLLRGGVRVRPQLPAAHPHGAIVTNVEEDHLDYYGSFGRDQGSLRALRRPRVGGRLLVLGRDVPPEVEHADARDGVAPRDASSSSSSSARRAARSPRACSDPGGPRRRSSSRSPDTSAPRTRRSRSRSRSASARAARRVEPRDRRGRRRRGVERFAGVERRFEPWGRVGDGRRRARLRSPSDRGARDARGRAPRYPRVPAPRALPATPAQPHRTLPRGVRRCAAARRRVVGRRRLRCARAPRRRLARGRGRPRARAQAPRRRGRRKAGRTAGGLRSASRCCCRTRRRRSCSGAGDIDGVKELCLARLDGAARLRRDEGGGDRGDRAWPCAGACARPSLSARTTLRVGGRAEWLLEPAHPDELVAAWCAARERGLGRACSAAART